MEGHQRRRGRVWPNGWRYLKAVDFKLDGDVNHFMRDLRIPCQVAVPTCRGMFIDLEMMFKVATYLLRRWSFLLQLLRSSKQPRAQRRHHGREYNRKSLEGHRPAGLWACFYKPQPLKGLNRLVFSIFGGTADRKIKRWENGYDNKGIPTPRTWERRVSELSRRSGHRNHCSPAVGARWPGPTVFLIDVPYKTPRQLDNS